MKVIVHVVHDDQPTGYRIAKIDQWSGRVICISRESISEIAKHNELNGPCLYFLVSQSGAGSAPRVYVGEADGFHARIKSHLNKPWWSAVVVFFSSDGSLTKSGIQYLESRCLTAIKDSGWCELQNGSQPTLPSIPDEDIGGLDTFYSHVKILMPVLGYNIFAAAPAAESGSEAEEPAQSSAIPIDTIVCPARQDGFESAFLGQHAWWAIRIGDQNRERIRYVAIYQVAPVSAITHYGSVDQIVPYEGADASAGKYKILLKGNPIELQKPVLLGKQLYLKPQAPKYAVQDRILSAKTLDDVWGK